MKSPYRSEQGQALLLVMMVLLVLFALATAAVSLAGSHRKTAVYQRDDVQAYYVADAGVERTLVKIDQEPAWFAGLPIGSEQVVFSHVPYAGGEIEEVKLKKASAGIATRVEIISLGTFGTARKTLKVSALVVTVSDLLKGVSVLPSQPADQKITGKFSLKRAQGSTGTVFVFNGNLTIGGSSEIEADVYASGSVNVEGGGKIEGNIYPNYSPMPAFPTLDEAWYRAEAQREGHYYAGNASFGGGTYNGVYFVEGDLQISGTYTGRAVIVAEGGITVDRNLRARSENDLLVLISLADVSIENSSVDAVVIAADAFRAWGNATLYGAVIARQLLGDSKEDKDGKDKKDKDGEAQGGEGKVTIVCNPQLIVQNLPQEVPQGVSSSIKITSWRERYPVL